MSSFLKLKKLFALRVSIILTTAMMCSHFASAQGSNLPPQLEMRVPFEPTAFPSEQENHLYYELHLTNYQNTPLHLDRIEVLNAEVPNSAPIATFAAPQLPALIEMSGRKAASSAGKTFELAAGTSVMVYVAIERDQSLQLPDRLLHRIVAEEGTVTGTIIRTHSSALHTLGPPLEGEGWLAHQGPGNGTHHRRGGLVLNGHFTISERYASDWNKVKNDEVSSGDPHDLHSYYGYGQPLLAVADGRIVSAIDGLPDNEPGQQGEFRPAVPTTMANQPGNLIVLDIGGGQFARYQHLKAGSVQVKVGDHVKRGQIIGRVGNSGDSRGPHLHFEVSTSAEPGGEGVPFVFDVYSAISAAGKPLGQIKKELPLKDTVVTFTKDITK